MADQVSPAPLSADKKVGIGAYISLILACVFFSGILTGNHWWSVCDFTTLNGAWGKVVNSAKEVNDHLAVTMGNFRGKGGNGAIDGFCFALTLIPGVMFAIAMVSVFEHYGALEAARKMLTPVLKPLMGVPGVATLALITSLQSTDGGAALTRQLKDAGELNEEELNIFTQFQYSADAPITNMLGSGAALFALTTATGELAVPSSIGVCLGVALVMKFAIANVMRFLLIFQAKKKA